MGAAGVRAEGFAPLQLQLVDRTQWCSEVIRLMLLFVDRTPQQRAHKTHLHPATVRKLTRRVRQHGMLGLLPDNVVSLARMDDRCPSYLSPAGNGKSSIMTLATPVPPTRLQLAQ